MSPEFAVHLGIHLVLVLVAPPLLLGIIQKTKAFAGGRAGPPLLQPYFDLHKLLRKGFVLSRTTTWIFVAGPIVSLATVLVAALLVPLGVHAAPLAFAGDFVLLAYLLGLGRFATVLAAMDTGSSFQGMGAAREATFSALSEPALFCGLLVLSRRSASLSLSTMLDSGLPGVLPIRLGAVASHPIEAASVVSVLAALFVVLLSECSRVPFDDPATHLELTMIHEVMVLDHGGPLLGLVLYGASVKMFVLGAILVRLSTAGITADVWKDWIVFAAGIGLLGVLIGTVESITARLRLSQVPQVLLSASLLSAFAVLLLGR